MFAGKCKYNEHSVCYVIDLCSKDVTIIFTFACKNSYVVLYYHVSLTSANPIAPTGSCDKARIPAGDLGVGWCLTLEIKISLKV